MKSISIPPNLGGVLHIEDFRVHQAIKGRAQGLLGPWQQKHSAVALNLSIEAESSQEPEQTPPLMHTYTDPLLLTLHSVKGSTTSPNSGPAMDKQETLHIQIITDV